MKISFITPTELQNGGVEVFTRDLSSILRSRNHEVNVIGKESVPYLDKEDMEFFIGEYFNKFNKKNPQDVVICNGEYGYAVNHPRAINVFHGNYYGYALSVKDLVPEELTQERLGKAEMQKISAKGKYVVTVSNSSKKQLEEFGISVDKVINNSVNPDFFHPMKDVQKGIHVLALARGRYYEKGFDILKRLADKGIKMRLFSNKKIDNPNVDNHDKINNKYLGVEYNKAQVLLFPSRFEGGSLTTLESMACGCPVLTTPTGYGHDLQEVIPNFVAETFDEFMAKYLLVKNERDKYSKKATDYFNEFHNPQNFKENWVDLVENL